MGEISTRVWLDESLWNKIRERAVADDLTVRELIPRLVERALAAPPARAEPKTEPAVAPPPAARETAEPGLPTIVLSDLYHCDVCGGQVKLGGLTIHMGKHMKERQTAEAERS